MLFYRSVPTYLKNLKNSHSCTFQVFIYLIFFTRLDLIITEKTKKNDKMFTPLKYIPKRFHVSVGDLRNRPLQIRFIPT